MEKGHDLRPVTGELRRKAPLAHALCHAGLHGPADGPLQLAARRNVGKAALLLRRVGAARRTVKKQRQLPPGAGSLRPKKGRLRLRNAPLRRPANGLRIISALRRVKKRKRQRRAIQSLQIQNRPAVHRPCRNQQGGAHLRRRPVGVCRPEPRCRAGDIGGGKAGALAPIAFAADGSQPQILPRGQQVHRIIFLRKRRHAPRFVAGAHAQNAFVAAGIIDLLRRSDAGVARAGDQQDALFRSILCRRPEGRAVCGGAGGKVDDLAVVKIHGIADRLCRQRGIAAKLSAVFVCRTVDQRHQLHLRAEPAELGSFAARDDGGDGGAVAQPVLCAVLRAEIIFSREDALRRNGGGGNARVDDGRTERLTLRRKRGEGEERKQE